MSRIILVRHAKALDRAKATKKNIDDCDRGLTKEGIKKLKENIRRNKKLFKKIDIYVTSTYLRAEQTLDVILKNNKAQIRKKTIVLPQITPEDRPQYLMKWLKKHSRKNIVIVSHEPFLSNFLEEFLGVKISGLEIKKSCFIELQIRQSQLLLLAFHYA